MLAAILSLFLLALLAAPFCRWAASLESHGGTRDAGSGPERPGGKTPGTAGTWAPRLLALVPLAWAAEFARRTASVTEGAFEHWQHPWIAGSNLGLPRIDLAFRLDGLSLLFALLVCAIGGLVVLYAGAYFDNSRDRGRFLGPLFAFMASMLGLVLADDLLLLFLFWELTSISSYLLIGFGHRREAARKAALQALLVTALGGLGLLAGLLLLVLASGTGSISELLQAATDPAWRQQLHSHPLYLPLLLLIVLGAATKSAQFPFHFWLPGAMSAPAPASAYLHSSTMVKAGVYLLARLHPVLGGTSEWFTLLASLGITTMLVGAWLALRHRDLKRVLAYSTVSVLGTLFFLLALDADTAEKAVVVLILAHALYKSTLFLTTGALDYATGTRDVEELSQAGRQFPGLAVAAILAALSMAGAPLFYGFLGKETLLQATLESTRCPVWIVALVLLVSVWTVVAAGLSGVRPFLAADGRPPTPVRRPLPTELWLAPVLLGVIGFVFGTVKSWPGQWWVEPATSNVQGRAVMLADDPAGYGSLAFVLKMTVLASGVLLYLFHVSTAGQRWRERSRGHLGWLQQGLGELPVRTWQAGVSGVLRFASWQSRKLQGGTLGWHLRLVITSTVVLLGTGLLLRAVPESPTAGLQQLADTPLLFSAVALAGILLGAAGVAVTATHRLAAVTALGVVGFAVAALFLLFGAPDLAMTLMVTETLTVVLLVLAFYHLPHFERFSSPSRRRRDALLASGAGVLMTTLVLLALDLHSLAVTGPGAAGTDAAISAFFAEQSVPAGHGRNVVNVILVDFRALDTLGELTVVALAGLGVYALLRLKPPGGSSLGARKSGGRH